MKRLSGFFLAFVTMTLWAFLPIKLQFVMRSIDPVTITWFRFLVSFLVMLALFAFLKRKRPELSGAHVYVPLLICAVTLPLNYLFNILGLRIVSPTSSQLFIQLGPLFLALGGFIFFGEHFSRKQWFGVLLLTMGLGLFMNEQLLGALQQLRENLLGDSLTIAAALLWAVYAVFQKRVSRYLQVFDILTVVYLAGAVMFFPFAKIRGIFSIGSLTFFVLVLCAVNTLLAYGAFSKSLSQWEASRVASVLAMGPLATLGFTYWAHAIWPILPNPDVVGAPGFLGATLVVCGSMSIALGKRPPVDSESTN